MVLFERQPRGVALTEAGELFLERARTALAAIDAAQATGVDFEAGRIGSIRVGIAGEVRSSLLPSLLHDFGRARPDIAVTTVESHAGTVLRDLAEQRLDTVVAPSSFGSADLRRTQLGREPWIVLAGPGHRLAAAGAIDDWMATPAAGPARARRGTTPALAQLIRATAARGLRNAGPTRPLPLAA